MARFTAEDADNYGGNGGTSYFSLKNDKETARVRIMYNSMSDVYGLAIHTIQYKKQDGSDGKRYINCLREYNEPVSKCPFCAAKMKIDAKLFVPLYDIENDCVKFWERGKKFFSQLSSYCSRYKNPVSHITEIERNGKPKDTSTTYMLYEIEQDDITLEDLPEIPPIVGGLVLDKSADEMEYWLDNGDFPRDGQSQEDEPPFRSNRRESADDGVRRRTPSNTGRGDRY